MSKNQFDVDKNTQTIFKMDKSNSRKINKSDQISKGSPIKACFKKGLKRNTA